MNYINDISESDQNILDNINNFTLDKIEDILRHNINEKKIVMLAHIFNKLCCQTVGIYLNDLKAQDRKEQLEIYCSILYSNYVEKGNLE
jgi:CRISPR/Cas system CMR-associated protein Cmr3 (group 5 of RAMP superfamily)